jgi:3',5'-cyclic AMP phosphodiesterase CpdA
MDGVIDNEITANGYFPKNELDWLDSQLKNNSGKKVIIVQHFPVVEPFKSVTHKVRNADKYLEIIDKYSNVIAVLSGHYHAAKITRRKNVLHISTPALVEYPNAFREIKITILNDSTKFDIRLIETNLKNVQKLSKSRSKNPTLEEGQKQDRNAVIIIKNSEL